MKKSTFQKPDATYPHGSLREQPEMKRPTTASFGDKVEDDNSVRLWKAYQRHLKTLREIPCSENNWKDGQELEEEKDYELFECDLCDGCGWYEGGKTLKTHCIKCNGNGIIAKPIVDNVPKEFVEKHLNLIKSLNEKIAVPIVQETEDELWNGLIEEIEFWSVNSRDTIGEFISKLKSNYFIQKRKQ